MKSQAVPASSGHGAGWWIAACLIVVVAAAVLLRMVIGNEGETRTDNATAAPAVSAEALGTGPGTAARFFPSVRLALTGVAVAGQEAVAFISIEDQPPKPHHAGQEVLAGVTVDAIYADRVVLKHEELSKTLYLRAGAAAAAEPLAGEAAEPIAGDVPGKSRNPSIDPQSLSYTHPGSAEDFLRDVKVAANHGGGFLVEEVAPESLYERMGLQPGDVVYSLDSMNISDIDPPSKQNDYFTGKAELQLEVFRNGRSVILTYRHYRHHPQD